jgi:hypothetical protein
MSGDILVGAAKHARDWVDYAGIVLTGIGVIVVGLYTYYTKKQNKLTEEAMVVSNRAWIVPQIDSITPLDARSVVMRIENTGRIPAILQRDGQCVALVSAIPEVVNIAPEEYDTSALVIVPSGDARSLIKIPVLTAGESAEIQAGNKFLLASYHVFYTDAFKRKWETKASWWRGPNGTWYAAHKLSKLT